jgi:hypothetical protein
MLKFAIFLAILLWVYLFFDPSDSLGARRSGGVIYLLSIAIIGLILIGFLS